MPRAASSCRLGWCSGWKRPLEDDPESLERATALEPSPPADDPAEADGSVEEEGEEDSAPGCQGSVMNHMLGLTQQSAASRSSGCSSGFELST